MTVFFLVIFLIIFLGLFLDNKHKNIYCFSIFILFCIITYIKIPTLGNSDTKTLYIPEFYRVQRMNFNQIFEFYSYSEPFFYYLTKIFTIFSQNLNLYFLICAMPLLLAVTTLISKYSKNRKLSFLTFFSFYFPWMLIIVRHSIAWAFLIFAYLLLKNNKKIFSICCIFTAFLFHKTSLFFGIVLFLNRINYKKKYFAIVVVLMFVMILFKNHLHSFIFSLISNEHYLLYADKTTTMGVLGLLIYYCLSAFCILFFKTDNNLDANIIICGLFFMNLSLIMWDCFRIAMYFLILLIILIPNQISNFKNKRSLLLVNFIYLLFLIIYGINTFQSLGLLPYYSIF